MNLLNKNALGRAKPWAKKAGGVAPIVALLCAVAWAALASTKSSSVSIPAPLFLLMLVSCVQIGRWIEQAPDAKGLVANDESQKAADAVANSKE